MFSGQAQDGKAKDHGPWERGGPLGLWPQRAALWTTAWAPGPWEQLLSVGWAPEVRLQDAEPG